MYSVFGTYSIEEKGNIISTLFAKKPANSRQQEKSCDKKIAMIMVNERREQFRPVFSRQLTVGIVLCVLSVVPIGISLLFAGENEFLHVIATAVMLGVIAVGVLLIVRTAIVWDGYHVLLEEGDYTREAKEDLKTHANLGKIYWLLVTAGYLAWSFITNGWHRTWIVWPVAGVAYGAVFAIAKALKRKN